DVVFAQRLAGGEHQLVALPVVEHQRQRLGLRQALQTTEHDAENLGQFEGRGERADQLVDRAQLSQLLLETALRAAGRHSLVSALSQVRRCANASERSSRRWRPGMFALVAILPIVLAAAAPAFALPKGGIVDLSHPYDAQTIYWPTEDGFVLEKEH